MSFCKRDTHEAGSLGPGLGLWRSCGWLLAGNGGAWWPPQPGPGLPPPLLYTQLACEPLLHILLLLLPLLLAAFFLILFVPLCKCSNSQPLPQSEGLPRLPPSPHQCGLTRRGFYVFPKFVKQLPGCDFFPELPDMLVLENYWSMWVIYQCWQFDWKNCGVLLLSGHQDTSFRQTQPWRWSRGTSQGRLLSMCVWFRRWASCFFWSTASFTSYLMCLL